MIQKQYINGRYDILYDGGDYEQYVPRKYLRVEEEEEVETAEDYGIQAIEKTLQSRATQSLIGHFNGNLTTLNDVARPEFVQGLLQDVMVMAR